MVQMSYRSVKGPRAEICLVQSPLRNKTVLVETKSRSEATLFKSLGEK